MSIEGMRLCIAGSRRLTRYSLEGLIKAYGRAPWVGAKVVQVLSGGCKGADTIGEWWARCQGVPVARYEPKHPPGGYSAAAFHKRNRSMAQDCTHALVLMHWPSDGLGRCWHDADDNNRGSRSLCRFLREARKPHDVYAVQEDTAHLRLVGRWGYRDAWYGDLLETQDPSLHNRPQVR